MSDRVAQAVKSGFSHGISMLAQQVIPGLCRLTALPNWRDPPST